MKINGSIATAILAYTASAAPSVIKRELKHITITSHCSFKANIMQADPTHGNGCDRGENGACGSKGWVVGPESPVTTIVMNEGAGTSIKIGREGREGIIQFEYMLPGSEAAFFDLSDLDGAGSGTVGSPFRDVGTALYARPTSPKVKKVKACSESEIVCPPGKVCTKSYQHPGQEATEYCPREEVDFHIELCYEQKLPSDPKLTEVVARAPVDGGAPASELKATSSPELHLLRPQLPLPSPRSS